MMRSNVGKELKLTNKCRRLIGLLLLIVSFGVLAHEQNVQEGILNAQDGISLKVTLLEYEMPAHFQVFLYNNDQLISPAKAKLSVNLQRFNGSAETIHFKPVENYLLSNEVIAKPHSFIVTVNLDYEGKKLQWKYDHVEGRVTIAPAMAEAAGIKTAVAGNQTLKKQLTVVGKIKPNRDTMTPIYPRYAGIIKSLSKNLGEQVQKGESLVTIESNESLQNYTINAPISGTIVLKQAIVGEMVKIDAPIYEIADLQTVWADLTLYRNEAPLVKTGMNVIVSGDEGLPKSISTISYISPLGIEDSQTILARTILNNSAQKWLPGMYVDASIIIKEFTVPVAVTPNAIQNWQNENVVFVKIGDQYEATPVELGDRDDNWVEIRSGLSAGQTYVTDNSFFLKADLGKSGAIHED